MNTKILFTAVVLLFFKIINAQNNVYIVEGDSIDVPCMPGCVMLHAVHPIMKTTNTYAVAPITFAPISFTGTAVAFANDDYFSSAIPIGFSFCFFNNTYTQLCISDNGQLSFNTTYANNPSSFATQTPLPFYNNAFPDNAIFGPFIDAKLSLGGSVSYSTIGTTPNRIFAVKYSNVPYFNNSCSGSVSNNFQILLYETTNKIECHITNKDVCNSNTSNWLNYSTLGIQNSTATAFYTLPSKNASVWTANNEAFEFAPNGGNNFTLQWKTTGGAVIGTSDSLLYCPPAMDQKIILSLKDNCSNITTKDTIKIHQYKPKIDSITILQPLCTNNATGCITITGTTINPFLQYSLNNNPYQSINQFCNLLPGSYQVSIKDGQSCITNTIINIVPSSIINLTPIQIQPDSCPLNNGMLTVLPLGGLPPYTFLWSNGTTDSIATNLPGNTTYFVIVTDANGCTASVSMGLSKIGLPQVNATLYRPICGTANGSITINPYGAASPYSVLWNTGDTTKTINNLASGNYFVTVTSSNGCSTSFSFGLVDTLQVALITTFTNTTCGKPNGKINISASGGIAPYVFTFNGASTINLANTNLTAGTYIINVTDSNGCSKTNTVNILNSSGPAISFNISKPNCDSANGKVTATVTNAIGAIAYLWSNNKVVNNITNIDSGTYYLQITDAFPCIITDTVHVGKTMPPRLTITSYIAPSCFGDSTGSVTLSGSLGIPTYKYSIDNINFSAQAQIDKIRGGVYTILIKDASGCIRDTTVTFAQPDSMYGIIQGLQTMICFGDVVDSVSVQGYGGKPGYVFSVDNQIFKPTNTFYGLQSGDHIFYVKDTSNCTIAKNFKIDGPTAALQIDLIKEDIDCFETNTGSATASISGGWGNYAMQWSNGAMQNTINNLAADEYTIIATDAKGCIDSASIKVNQLLCCKAVLPNAFSPNGDGKNEILYVLGISEISNLRLRIFNRFGSIVFETQQLNTGWDGTLQNIKCDMGTYFYVMEYNCPFKKEKVLTKGDVTLVR
jgi:gliding motility-associated-like protein